MAKYLTTDTDLTSVANAIRTKGGTSAPLAYPAGFVSAIDAIPTGGGGEPIEEKDVNFIDYDGTILYSYTAAEAQELSALPDNPSHNGLTAQGWNWTLAQIKSQLTNVGGQVWVGQMYTTTSGATEIYIVLDNPYCLSPYISIAVNGTIVVDWGDNSATDTITGTSSTTLKDQQHIYASTGSYTIKITVSSGSFTFYGSINMESVLRMSNGTSTRNRGRNYSNTIKEIHIGSDAKIGDYAFMLCCCLKAITIPKEISSIGIDAFKNNYDLTTIIIPEDVTEIKNETFHICYGIKVISLPAGITSIGNNSMRACSILKKITIPNGVTSIGNACFQDCFDIEKLVFPKHITSVGENAFYGCYSLIEIILPEDITVINNNTLRACYSLQEIIIPENITSIGQYGFCNLHNVLSITIPKNVTSIGTYAFDSCFNLKELHVLPSSPPVIAAANVFGNSILPGSKIYVPQGKLTAYQTADNWSTYASYMEEEPA